MLRPAGHDALMGRRRAPPSLAALTTIATTSSSSKRRRRPVVVVRADASSGSSSGSGGASSANNGSPSSPAAAAPGAASASSPYVFRLGDGDVIFVRPPRQDVGPSYRLSWEDAVEVQLAALRDNDRDAASGGRWHPDHGVEVLYRFADFSPFERARYFGRSLDLGQFERFRRVMHSPHYRPLLNHHSARTLSTLRLGERCWRARLLVEASDGGSSSGLVPAEERVYEMTMVQRLGGVHDGYWFTSSLVAEGNDWTDVLAM
jgi:hypothetical protein